MSTKSTSFELFRYQLLPIDRFLQGNLLTGVGSIDELISRKNEFFSEAISGTKNFSDKRHETITKKLYEKDDFFLLRIAHNRSIHRETKDFRDEVIDNWPSILVAIWNHPEKQFIAVQRRSTAFSSCEVVVKMIVNSLSPQLGHHHLRAIHEPLFEKQQFWSLLHQYEGRIKSVEFEIITPNMANISGSLSDDLKDFAKATNSARNKLKIESDPEAPLHLEESNRTLQGLVNYSSEGGGNISLKIDGVKKTYHTSKTVKEIQLGDMEIQGNAEEVASVIKELLK
ncbi:hypothetical protein H0S63_22150 [Shewanella algae]|jgi:hypothetical protein|nr:hypothetical protein [Shewanella algae]MBC8798486.1 hypothetical protein [Shewanella algae]PWF90400.1 hypothetical protein DD549_18795 [Shewanella algae]